MVVQVMEAPRATAGQWRDATFDDFFLATATLTVGLVALVTGDTAAAEDAAQVAYLRAADRWHEVSRMDRPDAWVARVAARVAIDDWRRRRRERPLHEGLADVQADIQAAWLRWGIAQLSPRQRAAFLLHHAHGLPLDEVAASMDTSRDTVKTHLFRARRRLRRLFTEEEP